MLLDASLSMTADSGQWQAASDTAAALGRVRWFGDARPWTDSVPGRGRSDLGPALAAAVAIGRRIVVVTDGELGDVPDIPAELLASTGIVVLPRPRGRDLAITEVSAPARATVGDTIAVTADVQLTGADSAESAVVVLLSGTRVLARKDATVAPGATVPVRFVSGTRGLAVGTQLLRVRIENAADREPRDDARTVAVELSGTPGIVMLASPGDWDARFLYRTLREVADLPVRGYVRLDGERWRDMDGLREVPAATVRAAARGADLLVVRGAARGMDEGTGARGLLRWPDAGGPAGEWYASAAPISPIGLAFLGVPVDSLPPVTDAEALAAGSGDWVGLSVQAGRRGAATAGHPWSPGRSPTRGDDRRRRILALGVPWRAEWRRVPRHDGGHGVVVAGRAGSRKRRGAGGPQGGGPGAARHVRADQRFQPVRSRVAGVGWDNAAGHAPLRRRRARVALAAPGCVPVSPRRGSRRDRDRRGGHLVSRVAPAAGCRRAARHDRGRRRGAHQRPPVALALRARAPVAGRRVVRAPPARSALSPRVRFPP